MPDARNATDQRILRSRRERIDDERWQRLFAGRHELVARLGGALEGGRPHILALSGLGGMGKSYALHSLRPEINPAVAACPVAWLNFQAGETQVDAASALWSARQQLRSTKQVRTTRFDIVFAESFRRAEGRSMDRAQLLGEDMVQIMETLGRLEDVPIMGFVARTANWLVDLGGRAISGVQQRAVRDWFVAQPEVGMKSEWPAAITALSHGDLELLMPRALAADIADPGGNQCCGVMEGPGDRVVLVVDTYERVADHQAKSRGGAVPTFVEDLCLCLVASKAPAAVVISGRDPTYWGWDLVGGVWSPNAASPWGVPPDADDPARCRATHYEACAVDVFSGDELREYLVQRRELPASFVEPIQRLTRGYVLAAAIAGDIVGTAPHCGADMLSGLDAPPVDDGHLAAALADRTGQLVGRLLEQLERAGRHDLEMLLRAAAIPRTFDPGLLYKMTRTLETPELTNELLSYSFVVPVHGSDRYRVHPVVRALLLAEDANTVRQRDLHEAAMRELSARAEEPGDHEARFGRRVEAHYHHAALSGMEGLLALDDLFEGALDLYMPMRCRAVLSAVADLPLEDGDSRALASLMRARLARFMSDYATMITELTAAERAMQGDDSHLALRILREGSAAHRLVGDQRAAHARLDRFDASSMVGESRALQGLSARNRALIYKDSDRVAEALEAAERAAWLLGNIGLQDGSHLRAMGIDGTGSALRSLLRLTGRLAYLTGNYVLAVEQLETFFDQDYDSQAAEYARLTLGHVLRQEDELSVAERLARDALDRFSAEGESRGVSMAESLLAQVLLAQGRDSAAAAVFTSMLVAGPTVNPYGPIGGHLGLAEVARISGARDEALGHFAQVIDGSRDLGTWVEEAHARIGRGLLLGEADPATATTEADMARELGRRYGIPWIELYAELCGVLAGASDAGARLDRATSCAARFTRRSDDADVDTAAIAAIERWLNDAAERPLLCLRYL